MNLKEFAETYIKAESEAWQKGKLDALQALEDPNVVYHSHIRDRVGWEAQKQDIIRAPQNMSNLRMEGKYVTGDGNLFALSCKWRFITMRDVPGLWPIGKEVTSDSLRLFRLENGKLAESWEQNRYTVSDPA